MSRGQAPDRGCPGRSSPALGERSSAADRQPGSGFPGRDRSSGTWLGGQAGGEDRGAAAGPRELQRTGLAPSPCCSPTRGAFPPPAIIGERPVLPDTTPRIGRTDSPGLRQCASARAGRAVRAERRPSGVSACHICTYLRLCWWSALFGMPIAGLASYDICID